jgi:hypothetical protein
VKITQSYLKGYVQHGGGQWGKKKGKPMVTDGNSSRNALS